jgi:ribosomal protein L32
MKAQLVIIHVSRSGHIGIRLTAHYDTARLNRKHALGHIHGTCYLAYASAAYNATLGEDEPLCISMTHREAKASSERADERRSLFKGAGAELIKISNCARCGENCSAHTYLMMRKTQCVVQVLKSNTTTKLKFELFKTPRGNSNWT